MHDKHVLANNSEGMGVCASVLVYACRLVK